ncbi:MAG: PBSX family phage terminase large subunit [Oscillospiraceae bacterium]
MISRKLTDIIAPAFYNVHNDIKKGLHTYYDLYGGRGSTKSSFISAEIVKGMMEDKQANAVIYRKVGDTLRTSVYEQIIWAIDALGVNKYWNCTVSPLQCTYIPTGQKIIFKGLDKAKKSKSIKLSKGYFKFLWFEELDEFAGIEEIRSVQQSVLRGGEKYIVFKSFNPPITANSWANQYVSTPREDSLRHHSTYLEVPHDWLGELFISDAEYLKKTNTRAYEHEYLGKAVGTGGNVFEFLEIRTISDDESKNFDRIYQGVDWGFYPDPFAFIRCYYNHNQNKVYLIDEYGANKQSNAVTAEKIKKLGYNDFQIMCDSAEPKSVTDYRDYGLNARGVSKPAGSVEYSHKWLQSKTIVIDPMRTPKAYKEIVEYEYERNKNGEIISGYPDRNNHFIDALRYALSPLWSKRGR